MGCRRQESNHQSHNWWTTLRSTPPESQSPLKCDQQRQKKYATWDQMNTQMCILCVWVWVSELSESIIETGSSLMKDEEPGLICWSSGSVWKSSGSSGTLNHAVCVINSRTVYFRLCMSACLRRPFTLFSDREHKQNSIWLIACKYSGRRRTKGGDAASLYTALSEVKRSQTVSGELSRPF